MATAKNKTSDQQQPDASVLDTEAAVTETEVAEAAVTDEKPLEAVEGPITGLWIKSVSEQGRRRAGFQFTREPYGIALSALTEDQIVALKADPMLIVEETVFTDEDAARVIRADGTDSE